MLKGGGDLVHLDQVVKRLGEDSEDRFHRTAQVGQGITDRNQTVFTPLHVLFSHAPWEEQEQQVEH